MNSVGHSGASRLNLLDAAFLSIERAVTPMHTGLLMLLDRPLTLNALVAQLLRRVPLAPVLTQRLKFPPLGMTPPMLELDREFALDNHVRQLKAPERGGLAALAAVAAQAFINPLRRDRPLWEVVLLGGENDGRCAVLGKIHHAIADGMQGMRIVEILFGKDPPQEPLGGEPTRQASALSPQGSLQRVWEAISPETLNQQLANWYETSLAVMESVLSPTERMPFNHALSGTRGLGWMQVSASQLTRIKRRFRCTVNDVVLAMVTGALRSYLEAQGSRTQGTRLKVLVPVSTRKPRHGHDAANEVSGLSVPLPTNISSSIRCLSEIVRTMRSLQNSGRARAIHEAFESVSPFAWLTLPLLKFFPFERVVNTVCTNVPGPAEFLSIAGRRVEAVVPLIPLADGLGLAFGAMTYAGSLWIGITADSHLVPDLRPLIWGLNRTLNDLWRSASRAILPEPVASDKPRAASNA